MKNIQATYIEACHSRILQLPNGAKMLLRTTLETNQEMPTLKTCFLADYKMVSTVILIISGASRSWHLKNLFPVVKYDGVCFDFVVLCMYQHSILQMQYFLLSVLLYSTNTSDKSIKCVI